MASKATWLVIVLFVCFNCKCNQASNSNLSREEELELEAQLKLLNKPSIKTFQTKEGDIIDCVDINKQPALDHPLLKNHKVQTRPSRHLSNLFKDSSESNDNSFASSIDREPCPVGFVPIRRTLKKDLLRIRSLSSKKPKSRSDQSLNKLEDDYNDYFYDIVKFPYDQNVVSHSMVKGGRYYGADARFAVYDVNVTSDQSSSSNIWVTGGPSDAALNVLLAGWQANPSINGDSFPRLFVYWTTDAGAATGCYNYLCQGFVQVHRSISAGARLSPSSTYQGRQYEFKFGIIQEESNNWWVLVGEKQEAMGYWPSELFPHLRNGSDQVAWGGIAKPSQDGESPPLGNGHKPNKGQYNEGCFIRSIHYLTEGSKVESPNWYNTLSAVSSTDCYGLNATNQNCGYDTFKYCFTYGGPGGHGCQLKNF